MNRSPLRSLLTVLALVGVAALLAGCATAKIDWASRVGNYSYDQAVLEFGPPDKQATLSDGTVVAEWLTRRGNHHLYASPGYYPYWYEPGPTYIETPAPDLFLRLTFDPAGRLQEWKKLMR